MDLLNDFSSALSQYKESLSKYTIHQLQQKPDIESWSLGQLYMHLLNDTNWYFDQIEIALQDKDHQFESTSEKAAQILERGSFGEEKIKGDPQASINVLQPNSTEYLRREFEYLENRAKILWEKVRNNPPGKSKHPGLSYFNSLQWFQFAELHLRHHLKQKDRILSHLK
jgi:hypothetical protein